MSDLLARLEATVAQRLQDLPAGSYITELSKAGHHMMATTLVEKSYQLVEACALEESGTPGDIPHSAADLLFHWMVLLKATGHDVASVERELVRRFDVS
ncbi:MAG: phosphoribosyl-ATP diphosphatase [Planctomyces sp.]|nr:phosphoribosyl-ATP diphosphatase [Planctomyces sp.]